MWRPSERVLPPAKPIPVTDDRALTGIYSSLSELIALQDSARACSIVGRQPANSALAGRRGSRLRGRGLSFEEMRVYRPGDDIRTIDWRVTARTRVPHTRVFLEERERPVLLVIDQRLAMFFGTRQQMKSVTAAELSALVAWQVLAAGDRVGALVFNDKTHSEIAPHRSRSNVLQLLDTVVRYNRLLTVARPQQPEPGQLNRMLADVARQTWHDWLIIVVSDFQGIGQETRESVKRIARRNDVIAMLVHDPTAIAIPETVDLVISDTRHQARLDASDPAVRAGIAHVMHGRREMLERLRHELGIPTIAIDTGGDVLGQLARALGVRGKKA